MIFEIKIFSKRSSHGPEYRADLSWLGWLIGFIGFGFISFIFSDDLYTPDSGASNSEEDTSFYKRRPFRRAIFGLSFFLILTCLCGGYLNFISNGAIVPAPVPMDVICTQYVNDLLGADLASTQALIQQAVAHSAQNNKTALASMAPYLFSPDFAILFQDMQTDERAFIVHLLAKSCTDSSYLETFVLPRAEEYLNGGVKFSMRASFYIAQYLGYYQRDSDSSDDSDE